MSEHMVTCLCKKVEFSFELEKKEFAACHCKMCRNWGGGPLMSILNTSNVSFVKDSSIKRYNSSNWAERGFCSECGTHLFYKFKGKELYHIPLGLLASDEGFKFDIQFFIDKSSDLYSFKEETKCLTEKEIFEMFS
ncbi:hypothetical protein A9Q84_01140 [Halobacteriovorax marinus]|uniref:CENP-V/GFA domain-containing protein n=1 Tax=Halobacteriovorax marinus TaxID=97084 RepID=A0A1Y5FIH3_9BACT|nr:hypothetical protein A9Q84_01140 [Halobacteriovorax marinus]